VARVEALSKQEALEQMLAYNHTLSCIVADKFVKLRTAVQCFLWSFVFWLALMALVGVHSFVSIQ